MAAQKLEISGLVESIVMPLVDHEEDVQITSHEEEDGTVLVEISVNEEDAGKVIGRQGRVIKSIRTLARALGQRVGTAVEVEVLG